MDNARALPATSDHPIDLGNLQIEERSQPRFPTQRIDDFGIALHLLRDRIEAGKMHSNERHLLKHNAKAALCDFAVIVRGRDLPVTRITALTNRIEAAHEF